MENTINQKKDHNTINYKFDNQQNKKQSNSTIHFFLQKKSFFFHTFIFLCTFAF